MSCRFLIFFLLIIQQTFTSIHISPNRNQLQYTSHSNQRIERVKRRTTSDIFQIHIHYDQSVEK
jgi:hypothetical protein